MKGQIYVLKRSNGFIGIYVNGRQQKNLVNNSPVTMSAEYLFNRINMEYEKQAHSNGIICEIIFTEDEENFKSNLPSLDEIIGGL